MKPLSLLLGLGVGLLAPPASPAAESLVSTPFAPPSSPAGSGAPLFTRLSAAQTGLLVENRYDDPTMWGARYREFMGGGMGSGVAAGDFDGDGRVDLYVSTKTKPGRLFRNLGGWRFEDVTEAAGLAETGSLFSRMRSALSSDAPAIWRQGAVFADVNNDGRLDLYVCRNAAPNLLYLNQGDGTFREDGVARGLAIVDGSVIGAFADYDRDGWLDVLLLTNQMDGTEPLGRPDRLFRNTGDGHFTEVTSAAGLGAPSFGHAATWLDFNGDRWPDFHIANDFSGADYLYQNNQDGTFTNVIRTVVPHTPYSSMGADIADVNHDGHIDLFVADMATTTREKDRRGLAASRDDVLRSGTRTDAAPQYMRNALYLNTGRGVFAEAACWAGIAATDWTWSVRFEDFDHDGWTDLHVTNGMVREANNSDLLARMMRALSDPERIRAMKDSPPLNESNLAYRNLAGEGFAEVTRAWGLEEIGVSFGAATADLDQDGDLDLVYLNYEGGLSVFRNDVVGRHRVQVRLRGTTSNHFGVGAVVRVESESVGRQSQSLTVARGYAAGSELVAHFGLGSDASIQRLTIEWPSGTTQILTDLAADRAYVITERDEGPESPPPAPPLLEERASRLGLAVETAATPDIPDTEQIFLPFRTDRRGPGIAVADLDGDGHLDLHLGGTSVSPARILRWRDGRYHETAAPGAGATTAAEDGPALFLDVDGNGSPDLLVTRAGARADGESAAFRPTLHLNRGDGTFASVEGLPAGALNIGALCAADIDGDGDLDVFLGGRSLPGRYPETPRSHLWRNEGGRFVDATADNPALGRVGLVKSALFRDVDLDGRPDLIVALEWDYVRYFRNDGEGRFSDRTEAAGFTSGGRGWWNSLAAADFNGDGRIDFAAGNLGLNTTYRASATQPAVLLYGDFARNGTPVIAEGVYEGDTLYPLRARNDLGTHLPFVLRSFRRNDDFARATLDDVLGAPAVAQAARYEADTFASGVFLSQPDGTYRFTALPAFAQLGPIHGLVAADVDGDGLADLAAVQNSDAAMPRFHGGVGVVLRGRGDGAFTALTPADSGFVVPGDGRALVQLDPTGEGRPGLFHTRHGGRAGYFAPTAEDVSWLHLRLQGPSGNPDAVGARIRLEFSNGTVAHHEPGLGGGWLSQEAPGIFVAQASDRTLTSAEVRWPHGRITRHRPTPMAGPWIIAPPPPP